MPSVDVAILTSGHNPEDGRLVRHVAALQRAGMSVDLSYRNSTNRFDRFLRGPWWALGEIRRTRPKSVILPDPELQLFVAPIARRWTKIVSDVHEDYGAVALDRSWINKFLSPAVKLLLFVLAKIRHRYSVATIVADRRIDATAVLVTNRPNVIDLPIPKPEIERSRLVYVGDVRLSRGLQAMLDLLVRVPDVQLDIVGPCTDQEELACLVRSARLKARVEYHGRLPYIESWELASNALAGLCLLEPTPAFELTRPTKLWEYWTVGVPVLASDLSGQRELIQQSEGGMFGDLDLLENVLTKWRNNPLEARQVGLSGRRFVESSDDGSESRLVEVMRQDDAGSASSIRS